MTVQELINKLKCFPPNLPVSIDGCMDFTEAEADTIKLVKRQYIGYPFTEDDKFDYISLELADNNYWKNY